MGIWIDRIGGMILDAGLASTVVLSLVALIILMCRQPARRILLARCAILGSLALIPLSADLIPRPQFPILGSLQTPSLSPSSSIHPNSPSALHSLAESPRARPVLASPLIYRTLSLIYLLGVTAGLCTLVLGYWGLGWLSRNAREPSQDAQLLYASQPFSARRPRPLLLVTSRIRRPALIGLFHQRILIPESLDLPGASDQLRLSLLHELAHAERRDPWFSLASGLAQSFWFFLPPLWWIRAQMRLDQEFLADRTAADRFGPLAFYASSLLNLASQNPSQHEARPIPRGSKKRTRPGSALFQRLLMLVQCPFPLEPAPPRWCAWLVPALVFAGCLAASSLSLKVPASEPGPSLTNPPAHRFHLAHLSIKPQAGNPRLGRVDLPLRMPPRFDLQLEVWGNPQTLEGTRVAGIPIHTPSLATPDQLSPAPGDCWHQIHLRRDANSISLTLDGRNIPLPPTTTTTQWLTVESASDRPAQYRRLTMTW